MSTGTKFLSEELMTRRAQSVDNKAKDSNSEHEEKTGGFTLLFFFSLIV